MTATDLLATIVHAACQDCAACTHWRAPRDDYDARGDCKLTSAFTLPVETCAEWRSDYPEDGE